MESFLGGRVTLHCGDNRDVLRDMPDCSVDSIVTDPPYALVSITKRFGADGAAAVKVPENGTGAYARASAGFMGQKWDTGDTVHAVEFWAECLRVLKPGGHLVSFAGTRTYHRMAVAIEDAGFEIRDMISWVYGSGFPKSHDVSKGIDRAAGAERKPTGRIKPGHEGFANRGNMSSVQSFNGTMGGEGGFSRPWMNDPEKVEAYHQETAPATEQAAQWQGWGTALKPAVEPICLARKPLSEGTVAANVLKHGTGAINVDGCRVESGERRSATGGMAGKSNPILGKFNGPKAEEITTEIGRWPANLIHDGSEEVIAAFPESESNIGKPRAAASGNGWGMTATGAEYDDSGSAARFFYTAKADSDDRIGSKHPTVKPVDLMQWLVRLVTPKGGLVLDPFAGTGTTAEACFREGMRCILIEREMAYRADIRRRMALVLAGPDERARESIKARGLPRDDGPLFGGSPTLEGGGRLIYGDLATDKLARRD